MTPVCSVNCCEDLNASEAEIRSAARRRVRKSRGEQEVRKRMPTRDRVRFFGMSQRYPKQPGCARRTAPSTALRAGEGGCPHMTNFLHDQLPTQPTCHMTNLPHDQLAARPTSTTCDCKQTRASVWGEGAVGDLAIEVRGPAARDLGGTIGTTAVGSEAVVFDEISVAADQG